MDAIKLRDLRDRHRLLLSVALVIPLLAFTWVLIPITFETNDDAYLMSCLSGAKTGKPEADTIFSLFLWGKIVSSLYTLNVGVPWYTLIFMALITLSLITVCYCVILSFPRCGGSLFCLLYFCMFLYYSVIFQYTVVSAYCGVAAVSLLLIDKKGEDRKYVLVKNILIFSFTFFAVNIRSRMGYLLLGSVAFAICLEILAYLLFRAGNRQKIKRMFFSFFIILATVIISMAANDIRESMEGWAAFREYNSERVRFTDYSKPDYESNQDLFERIGWSEEFYELVKRWFFMDETVNTETLRRINERSVRGSIRVGRSLLHEWFPKIEFQVKMWVLLLVFLLLEAAIHRERRLRRCMVSFLWLFVWFAETQYFGYKGRIAERAFEAWTLLAVVPSILGSAGSCETMEDRKRSVAERAAIPVLLIAFCIVCVIHPGGGFPGAKEFSLARGEGKIINAYVEEYVINHPENIYIAEMSVPREGEPWRVYDKGLPYNFIFWGGSFYHSPLYYEQLEKNGLEHIYMEDFFEGNIYFIAREKPDENLYHVMLEKFPECTYEIIEENNGFIVYKYLQ